MSRGKRARTGARRQALADAKYLRYALKEARRGAAGAWPNPMVGAVVLDRSGRLVGRGYHRRPGQPHAEVVALRRAGSKAKGGTLYVNLEPCSHDGRTPPCADAVIEAGIAVVVFGIHDPNPQVSGAGARRLVDAGIEVRTGVCADACRRLNEVFLRTVTAARPFVTMKSATTLDGRVATRTGDSRWITGEASRRRVHAMRRDHGAVLVGVGTVIADDPSLTVRSVPGESPLRIVVDSTLRTPLEAKLASELARGTVFACHAGKASADARRRLESRGAQVWDLPGTSAGVDLDALLARAFETGIASILVEGGHGIFTSFLKESRVDKVSAFVAPRLLGGGLPVLGDFGFERMDQATGLHGVRIRAFGADALLEGYVDPYYDSDATDPSNRPRGV